MHGYWFYTLPPQTEGHLPVLGNSCDWWSWLTQCECAVWAAITYVAFTHSHNSHHRWTQIVPEVANFCFHSAGVTKDHGFNQATAELHCPAKVVPNLRQTSIHMLDLPICVVPSDSLIPFSVRLSIHLQLYVCMPIFVRCSWFWTIHWLILDPPHSAYVPL